MTKDDVGHDRIKLSSLEQKSRPLARFFHKLGLGRDDTCHLYLPNTTDFFYPVMATLLCGGVISMGDPKIKASFMALQLDDTEAKIVFCTKNNLDEVKKAVALRATATNPVHIIVMLTGPHSPSERVYSYEEVMVEGEALTENPDHTKTWKRTDRMAVIWSSGTTGRPKGIQNNAVAYVEYLFGGNPESPSPILQTTCFFHSGGFGTPVSAFASATGVSVFFPVDALEVGVDASSQLIFQATEKFKTKTFMMGSHHITRISNLKEKPKPDLDLSSVALIFPMGSNIPEDSFEKLKAIFPELMVVGNFYSLTEFGGLITMSFTPKNIGGVAYNTKVKIVDTETGEKLGPGEVGEIMAKCGYEMMGYLKQPEVTAAFWGEDGYVHTGDLGHYDEEGIMYFDGRKKDLIKFENKHLYPIEVEEVAN